MNLDFLKKLTNEQKDKLKSAFNALTQPVPAPAPAPAPMAAPVQEVPLADGTTILKYDTPTLSVGSVVTIVTPEGEIPAPVGEHTLQDGTVIKVEVVDGVAKVTEMSAPEMPPAPVPAMPQMQEAVNALTSQFADLKKEFEAVKAEKDALKSELETVKANFSQHSNALKELTPIVFAIAEIPSDKPIEAPANKPEKKSGLNKYFNHN